MQIWVTRNVFVFMCMRVTVCVISVCVRQREKRRTSDFVCERVCECLCGYLCVTVRQSLCVSGCINVRVCVCMSLSLFSLFLSLSLPPCLVCTYEGGVRTKGTRRLSVHGDSRFASGRGARGTKVSLLAAKEVTEKEV